MESKEKPAFNPDTLRASQMQTTINGVVDRLSEKTSKSPFGIYPGTWILVFFTIGLGVIMSVFPVVMYKKETFCLIEMPKGTLDQYGGLALFLIANFGFSAAFSRIKALRIIFSCLAITTPFVFFLFSRHIPSPEWGMLVYLCAAVYMIIFACKNNTSLGIYPNPFRDATAQKRWIYVALCCAAMLFFTQGCIMHISEVWRGDVKGWNLISTLHFNGAGESNFCQLFIILPVLAGIAVFTKRRIIHLLMSISLLVPALILICDKASYISFSTGFYMYILCTFAMIAMTGKPYLDDMRKPANEE